MNKIYWHEDQWGNNKEDKEHEKEEETVTNNYNNGCDNDRGGEEVEDGEPCTGNN